MAPILTISDLLIIFANVAAISNRYPILESPVTYDAYLFIHVSGRS